MLGIANLKMVQVDLAGERGDDRAGHQHVAVVAPLDPQRATVEYDTGAPVGQSSAVGVDQRRAGARSTRQGQTGAAFPDPQSDGAGVQYLREANVGPLREQPVML